MTRPDAEERATEPRSLQVFDRVPRLIGHRDLIGEKSAAGGSEKPNEVTPRDIAGTLAYRERSHPRERRERKREDTGRRVIPNGERALCFCTIIKRYGRETTTQFVKSIT